MATKIAIYVSSYPPKSGGIAASTYHLINLLREHFCVKVFVFNDGNESESELLVRHQTHYWVSGILERIVGIYLSKYHTKKDFPNCNGIFRMAYGISSLNGELKRFNPDIIIVPDHYVPAYWIRKPKNSKIIWLAKNNYRRFRDHLLLDDRNWADWDVAFSMERKALLKADALVAPSRYMLDFSEKTHRFSGPKKVIHNLVDESMLSGIRPDRNKMPFGNGYPIICIPSAGTANKGKRYIFEIVRRISTGCGDKVNFFLSGHIPEDMAFELKHVNNAKIYMPGHSDWKTNIMLASSCDLMVSPTLIENFSNAFLEAFCLGIPIVTFDIGGNREIIDDGLNGYVVSYLNVDDLIGRSCELVLNSDKRSLFADEAKRKLHALTNKEKILGQYIKLFEELQQ